MDEFIAWQIDPSIMGGLVVEFGQKVFDMSIKSRALQMERFLRQPIDIGNLQMLSSSCTRKAFSSPFLPWHFEFRAWRQKQIIFYFGVPTLCCLVYDGNWLRLNPILLLINFKTLCKRLRHLQILMKVKLSFYPSFNLILLEIKGIKY